MTFNEYWAEIEKLKILPITAIEQIPSSLSDITKKKLMEKRPEDTVRILTNAINHINHGSVESIDSLVRKRI